MYNLLKLHLNKLLFIACFILLSILLSLSIGEIKPWAQIAWLNATGKVGSAIALIIWMIFILGSRPLGRVTDLLILGLGVIFLAFWQNTLDEFIQLPYSALWNQLEFITMPIGILLLTYGLYHWHQEQLNF